MRKIPLVLLLCLVACRAISQEVSFYLPIMDNGRIVSYTDGVPIFDDPEINSIFEDYTVNHFAKAFPLSGYEYLQKVYLIKADSIGLAKELVSYDNILFPMYEEIGEAIPLGSYYPNDWTTYLTENMNWKISLHIWVGEKMHLKQFTNYALGNLTLSVNYQ